MLDKIVNLMQNNTLVFPRSLLANYKKMNLSETEVLFVIYLINERSLVFNPEKIGQDLSLDFEQVLELISNLTTKDLLEIKMIKENNIHQEYLDLEKLYKKLAFYIINEETANQEKKSNLYDIFEREFGRTLSPNEFMIIGKFDEDYGEELVLCALNEAIYNGVRNLRYIDHILVEWHQKGIKNKIDVENNKREFKKEKKETKKLFEYDYLNEDE
ncbi:MAG: DnaD domain protein [Bacilli bacterium]|nr:DnaD domain protein [Bacilli bacterium]